MPRVTDAPEGMVVACPECDAAGDVYRRTQTGNPYVGDPEAEYSCGKCSATFEEPNIRAKKARSGGGSWSKLERILQEGSA
jgi:DNA-directed RNA polymerase subunit RPC12/RpoP